MRQVKDLISRLCFVSGAILDQVTASEPLSPKFSDISNPSINSNERSTSELLLYYDDHFLMVEIFL